MGRAALPRPVTSSGRRPAGSRPPTTAAEAATIILDGVKAEKWRILVGKDAEFLDDRVRTAPEDAYSPAFYEALSKAAGWRI